MIVAERRSYAKAKDMLPSGAVWSSSFGNPGEGGYVEYWRTLNGERWIIANGPYDTPSFLLEWTCQKSACT